MFVIFRKKQFDRCAQLNKCVTLHACPKNMLQSMGVALKTWCVIGAQFRAGCFPHEGETGGWDMTYKKGVYYALVLTI